MTRYWWVNHKQTHRQEIEGEYLWSPKVLSNGRHSHFYDNLRQAGPGDFVLSMAHARVAHVGCVNDYALSTPKPEEFGKTGANWQNEGWLLPVTWMALPHPVRPKDQIQRLAPYLRTRYAPIQSDSGHGNQQAYLSEIDKSLFELVISLESPFDLASLIQHHDEYEVGQIGRTTDEIVAKLLELDDTLADTERMQLLKSRVGQGQFRANVQTIEKKCRITGIDKPELLIASHIKPWRSCESAVERLDGCNGLFLAPHVDYLFDRGFIGFEDSGTLLVSRQLYSGDIEKLALTAPFQGYAGQFLDAQKYYLDYHRKNVFLI